MHKAQVTFSHSLQAWDTPRFPQVFKQEMCGLDMRALPLQAALSQSSHVSERPIEPVVLLSTETADAIQVKAGIFFAGIIAGSCCADDPGLNCEQLEYCELLVTIHKTTAHVTISLLDN